MEIIYNNQPDKTKDTSIEINITNNNQNNTEIHTEASTKMDLFQSNDKATIIKYDVLNDDKLGKIENDTDYNSYLKTSQERKNTRHLILLEYISIILTGLSFIIFAVLAYEDDSVSAFAFSVDSFLDVLTYIIIIWRFSNIGDLNSNHKDKKALICIGGIFILSALAVEYESINNLVFKSKPVPSTLFIIMGILEAILFGVLAILKFLLARKFEVNKTIISDGINSLIAAAGALSMTIGMTIYVISNDIWFLDAIFGFLMGLFVFIYGCKLVFDNIFKK